MFSIENALYNITHETDGLITVANKSSSEVEKSLCVTRNEASALEAVLSGSSNNENFNNAISALSKSAQAGDKTVTKELAKLDADTNPVVASQERSSVNILFNVVSNELNGDTSALGRASGDFFKKATAWVRGLFNKADNTANVLLANGASYNVNGEKLDRLGFELGAKVTTYATDNVEISAGAQTSFRDDYQDYSFTFDAKYNF